MAPVAASSIACYSVVHDLFWVQEVQMTKTDPTTAAPAMPAIDDLLCFAIYSNGHAFNQLYRPLLSAIGLTYPQYLVMVALWGRDGRSVKELGDELFLDSSTLTPLLKRMEKAGLIVRARSTEDERKVTIRLTPQGEALKQRAAHIPGCIADVVGIDAQDVKTLQHTLVAIRDRVKAKV